MTINDEIAEHFIRKCEAEAGTQINGGLSEVLSGLLDDAYERGRRDAPGGFILVPRKLLEEAHPVMRETGWHLAPGAETQSDGVLEAAAAEIEEQFAELLRVRIKEGASDE